MSHETCTIERCDIFDFMAVHVGLTVIHPGGFTATRRLADSCGIRSNTRVLDLGCGKGTSAAYLARTRGCDVVGVDISDTLIRQAQDLATREGVKQKVSFVVGDVLDLPFGDGEFDAVIGQAVLVLVPNKPRAVTEAVRVARPEGRLGWLELTWRKEPPAAFLRAVSDVLCAYCMQNVSTAAGWEDLFKSCDVHGVSGNISALPGPRLGSMLSDEGVANLSKIAGRVLASRRIRRRLIHMNRFFAQYREYFGYGIYSGTKRPEPGRPN